MKNQISNVLITLIISGTALYGFGAFDKKELSYATVYFDGGFVKIGEIAEQRAFSEFKIENKNEVLISGTADEVIYSLQEGLSDSEDKVSSVFKDGVRIKGSVGIKWVGSESSFELTTNSLNLVSTEKSPIKIVSIIDEIEKMNSDVKTNNQIYADKALAFGENPQSSFLLSKIIDTLKK